MPSTAASNTWLSARAAALRLGITVYRLHALTLSGQIRTKVEPGTTPKYHAEDIDRIVGENKSCTSA